MHIVAHTELKFWGKPHKLGKKSEEEKKVPVQPWNLILTALHQN